MRYSIWMSVGAVGPGCGVDAKYPGVRMSATEVGAHEVSYSNLTGQRLPEFAAVYGKPGVVLVTFSTGEDAALDYQRNIAATVHDGRPQCCSSASALRASDSSFGTLPEVLG